MNDLDRPLASLLDPGERLLWSGQPKQGVRLQAGDLFLIPFSLMWGGFAIFWEAAALSIPFQPHPKPPSGDPAWVAWIFPLWGIPFVLVGLYMIFGRFFFDSAQRQRTLYAITDRRLIVFKSLFKRKILSYDYESLINLNLVERSDGSGDILFGAPGAMAYPLSQFQPRVAGYTPPGFYLLPGAREIYNQIRAARQAVKK